MNADDPSAPKSPEPAPPTASPATADLRKRAIRGGSLFVAVRLGAQILQWATTIVVARYISPDDYGLLTAAMVVLEFGDLLASAGMGQALVHKRDLEPNHLAQAFTVCLALAALLYAVLWFAAEPLAARIKSDEFAPLLRTMALVLWLVPISSVANALLSRDLALVKQSAVYIAMVVVQSVLVLGLAAANYGYWALAAGMMCARVVQTGLVWYASGWRPALAWPRREAWGLLRYSVMASGSSVLWYVYSNADFAAVGDRLGKASLGVYSFAFNLISMPVQKLSATVNQVAFATFCRLQDDRPRLRSWYLRLTVLLSVVSVPSLTGLALVADDAIPLILGDKWRGAVLSFQLLSPVGAMMVVAATVPPLLLALGRPDVNLRYTALCAIVYPPAFWLGAAVDGVRGVCIVWLVLYPLLAGSLIHFTRSITTVSLLDVILAHRQILFAVAAMIAAVLGLQWCAPWDSWDASPPMIMSIRLVLTIAVGAATYTTWILTFARTTVVADVFTLLREIRGRKAID